MNPDEPVLKDLRRLLANVPPERAPEINAVIKVMKALDRLPVGGQYAVIEILRAFRVLDTQAQNRLLAALSVSEPQ